MNKNEMRHINFELIRENNKDETKTLKGYAILYNSLSEPLYNTFRERILQGAFSESLKRDDQVCLWGHDTKYVLGRKSAGTLILREDEKGLYFEVNISNSNWANDLYESVQRGDITQMSFGFNVKKDRWVEESQIDLPIREVLEMQLHEISLVTFPAYSETNVRENTFIPKPPKKIIEDNFLERSSYLKQKINLYKLKNNL